MDLISKEFITKFNQRDEVALKVVIDNLFQPLVYWADKVIKNTQDSEDVVMNVFLKTWRLDCVYSSYSKLNSYLYLAVKRESLNRLRSIKIRKNHYSNIVINEVDDYNPEQVSEWLEFNSRVDSAIDALPPLNKVVIKMDLQYILISEISRMENISYGTAIDRKLKSIQMLKSLLKIK